MTPFGGEKPQPKFVLIFHAFQKNPTIVTFTVSYSAETLESSLAWFLPLHEWIDEWTWGGDTTTLIGVFPLVVQAMNPNEWTGGSQCTVVAVTG